MFYIYYTKLLHVSAMHPSHLQIVTFGQINFDKNYSGSPIMESGRDGRKSLSMLLDRSINVLTSKL
jgi:hypothetical protein